MLTEVVSTQSWETKPKVKALRILMTCLASKLDLLITCLPFLNPNLPLARPNFFSSPSQLPFPTSTLTKFSSSNLLLLFPLSFSSTTRPFNSRNLEEESLLSLLRFVLKLKWSSPFSLKANSALNPSFSDPNTLGTFLVLASSSLRMLWNNLSFVLALDNFERLGKDVNRVLGLVKGGNCWILDRESDIGVEGKQSHMVLRSQPLSG